jgi:flagellar L-ring protein precursor FlgH
MGAQGLQRAGWLLRAALLAGVALLGGCGTLKSLSEVGRPPEMTPSSDPTGDPKWRPMTMPMPRPDLAPEQANSLWRSGARAFFKDQRAAQVGDILTVLVSIADTATLDNATSAVRAASETAGLPNFLGLETQLPKLISKALNTSSLVSSSSANSNVGTGTIKRDETVTLQLAGVVTQVLPNGNLVVSARQEVRVNSELRELSVSGVVRPQDIASDNTVTHERMAEARISYGGRGTLTQLQQPRIGQQILDILFPF